MHHYCQYALAAILLPNLPLSSNLLSDADADGSGPGQYACILQNVHSCDLSSLLPLHDAIGCVLKFAQLTVL